MLPTTGWRGDRGVAAAGDIQPAFPGAGSHRALALRAEARLSVRVRLSSRPLLPQVKKSRSRRVPRDSV